MRQITARYSGKCAATGRNIRPGDPILFDPRTRRTYLQDIDALEPAAAMVMDMDPDLDRETAEAVGRYMAASARKYQSDIYRTAGREYFRNKAGRCEDAPCCGCCNF